jgi:uncharacterized protein (TIGR00297 family)
MPDHWLFVVTHDTLLSYLAVALGLGIGMFLSVRRGKLTTPAALTGGLLGWAIFLGAGFSGLAMLATFFVLGSWATSHRLTYKVQLGVAEANKGRRKASQVIANAGIGAIAGLLAWIFPSQAPVFQLMLAAAFASATADTLSSELGNLYGRRFYNILTFRPDQRGENGVVSLEGTALGLVGSTVIAVIYGAGFGWGWHPVSIVVAGTIGNLSDSVLGATLERKRLLNNDAVNFLNTAMAALAVLWIYLLT